MSRYTRKRKGDYLVRKLIHKIWMAIRTAENLKQKRKTTK